MHHEKTTRDRRSDDTDELRNLLRPSHHQRVDANSVRGRKVVRAVCTMEMVPTSDVFSDEENAAG